MLGNPEIITFVFKIVNLSVFVAFAVYCFKQYGQPYIEQQMLEQKKALDTLNTQKNMLMAKNKELTQAAQKQHDQKIFFNEKITSWIEYEQHALQEHTATCNRIEKSMIQRAEQQATNHQLASQYKQIAPQTIQQVADNLSALMADEQEGQRYLQKLLKHMEKNTL